MASVRGHDRIGTGPFPSGTDRHSRQKLIVLGRSYLRSGLGCGIHMKILQAVSLPGHVDKSGGIGPHRDDGSVINQIVYFGQSIQLRIFLSEIILRGNQRERGAQNGKYMHSLYI